MKFVSLRLVVASLLLAAGTSFAADLSPKAPDKLTPARTLIEQKKWAAAVEELKKINDPASADWNNLMGYSLRKADAANAAEAEKYYNDALADRSQAPRRARVLGRAVSDDRQPAGSGTAPRRPRQGVLPAVRGVQRP